MLTGDKLETAENIAYSCKLFTGNMDIMRLAEFNDQQVFEKMKLNFEICEECMKNGRKMAFIFEGESLAIILKDKELEKIFLDTVQYCVAVICCRATPRQKADVVRLIKRATGKITLAIGDGANDVNMMQEAHIGIGIYGNEGMRAVQASDYAIGEFQGLSRLLLVHGRWCYIRITEMIIYFFYKNILFTLPQFYFAFQNGYSANSVYEDWYLSLYNMIFTALPLLIKAIFEQDINYKMDVTKLIKKSNNGKMDYQKELMFRIATKNLLPRLYYIGQENKIFTTWRFVLHLTGGVLQGVLIFFFCISILPNSILGIQGYNTDIWYFSITMYITIVCVLIFSLKYLSIFIGCSYKISNYHKTLDLDYVCINICY